MKKITTLTLLLFAATLCQAQTFDEWFRQKKTQKKYLIDQITGLKVYAGYIQKGYRIGREGLCAITRIKDGDFSLHRDFFGSLSAVNPGIKKYPRATGIIGLQKRILARKQSTLRQLSESGHCSPKELAYCRRVLERLLAECEQKLEELLLITQDGKLVMKDDERLQRLDRIYTDMEANAGFCKRFCDEALQLIGARARERNELERNRTIYGLKN